VTDPANQSSLRRVPGAGLGAWVRERPWVFAIAVLGLFLLRYGMLGIALGGVIIFATLILAALAIADYVVGTEVEALRRQRARNVAIALSLGGLVLMFYVATIVRLGGNVLNRPM
jgi:hypothetical protein